MMTAVLDWADTQKIGFSHFISLGNKCDVDEVDFVEEIADDPDTSILILYLESVSDGKKFFDVVSKATKKKPVVILKSGISPAGKEAASSHTGALAGDDIAFDIAFERCGVIRAKTMKELFDLSNLFDKVKLPLGEKFAILTNAGGPGIIATDTFEQFNIEFAKFTDETTEKLRATLPAEASVKNPVDIVGDARPKRFGEALSAIFQESSDICAGALVLVTPQSTTDPTAVADTLVAIHKQYPDRLMLTTFIGGETMQVPRRIVESHGIPAYSFPEPAIRSLRALIDYKRYIRESEQDPNHENVNNKVIRFEVDDKRIDEIIEKAKAENRRMLLPYETSEICSMYGLPVPASRLAETKESVSRICEEVGFPIIMKIASPEIQHKTDCGGVRPNINSVEEAEEAFTEILNNVAEKGPKGAKIAGVEIQKMVDSSKASKKTEIIVGMSKDPQWGPMLMVGAGGIYANYMKDVSFELAREYTKDLALKQLSATKVYQILEGVRGEKPSEINILLETMMKVAQLVRDHNNIDEMDMNPIWVFAEGEGVVALDVKIMVS
ncbi:Acetyl-CoA synthetase [Tritrichomonas foetus]|uniref:Acetyl-CoA synthetase n=1 Tax=Tritrichomonas foetus TaxID=1144522 RepID=A0A1J4KLW5_9EUKA|nr:Acetyl-CoA synthetase [Tritrichomonas foetus]|eukprot:OHT12303.1 Acetyl-CoA synthetase [Tritrichomonas foetus]